MDYLSQPKAMREQKVSLWEDKCECVRAEYYDFAGHPWDTTCECPRVLQEACVQCPISGDNGQSGRHVSK